MAPDEDDGPGVSGTRGGSEENRCSHARIPARATAKRKGRRIPSFKAEGVTAVEARFARTLAYGSLDGWQCVLHDRTGLCGDGSPSLPRAPRGPVVPAAPIRTGAQARRRMPTRRVRTWAMRPVRFLSTPLRAKTRGSVTTGAVAEAILGMARSTGAEQKEGAEGEAATRGTRMDRSLTRGPRVAPGRIASGASLRTRLRRRPSFRRRRRQGLPGGTTGPIRVRAARRASSTFP